MLELDPRLPEPLPEPPDKKNPTRELWRACESLYAPHTGWSLDRLVAARDLGWFGGSPSLKPISMQAYLRNLARSHLMARPGVTEIEERTELSAIDAHDHYRWLTFALPEDLLMAALGVEPVPRRVDKDLPLLVRRLLDLGVAEIHQHGFPLAVGLDPGGLGEHRDQGECPCQSRCTSVQWPVPDPLAACRRSGPLHIGGISHPGKRRLPRLSLPIGFSQGIRVDLLAHRDSLSLTAGVGLWQRKILAPNRAVAGFIRRYPSDGFKA